MERYEEIFLAAAAAVLVLFLGALAYTTVVMHIALPAPHGTIQYTADQRLRLVLRKTPPFDHPGVREIAPGQYEAVVVAYTWQFVPDSIDVPAGAEVTFIATSADVIHGFFIPGTRINMMLIPGYVSEFKYRFRQPGTYLLLCHEYCGTLHHTMHGEVVVK
jgi:cytochrome c oxidase subunit II